MVRDVSNFGSMSPYVVIDLRHTHLRTQVAEGGGKKPKWNQIFHLEPELASDVIDLKLHEKTFTTGDHIGSAQIKVADVRDSHRMWLPITYESEHVGDLLVEVIAYRGPMREQQMASDCVELTSPGQDGSLMQGEQNCEYTPLSKYNCLKSYHEQKCCC